jgi:hypothetical protein
VSNLYDVGVAKGFHFFDGAFHDDVLFGWNIRLDMIVILICETRFVKFFFIMLQPAPYYLIFYLHGYIFLMVL